MKVNVKTTGPLCEFLPPDAVDDRVDVELDDGASPIDAMVALGMDRDERCIVAVNGEIVPRGERAGFVLSEGDEVSIMSPLAGG